MEIKEYISFLFTNKGIEFINYEKGYIVVSSENGEYNFTFNIRNLVKLNKRLFLKLVYKKTFTVYDVAKKEKIEFDVNSFVKHFDYCLKYGGIVSSYDFSKIAIE